MMPCIIKLILLKTKNNRYMKENKNINHNYNNTNHDKGIKQKFLELYFRLNNKDWLTFFFNIQSKIFYQFNFFAHNTYTKNCRHINTLNDLIIKSTPVPEILGVTWYLEKQPAFHKFVDGNFLCISKWWIVLHSSHFLRKILNYVFRFKTRYITIKNAF